MPTVVRMIHLIKVFNSLVILISALSKPSSFITSLIVHLVSKKLLIKDLKIVQLFE